MPNIVYIFYVVFLGMAVQGVTPKEAEIISHEHINVSAIGTNDVIRALTHAGFTSERAAEIRSANEPQFNVYGASSAQMQQIATVGGKGFTGKVEESGGGQPSATTYFYHGTPIAKTSGIEAPTVTETTSGPQMLQARQASVVGTTDEITPLSITSARTPGGIITQDEVYSLGFWEKLGQSFGAVKDVGKIGQEGFSSYYSKIVQPWEKTVVTKEGIKELTTDFRQMPGGTIIQGLSYIPSPGFDINKITPGEYKLLADIKSGLPYSYSGVPETVKLQRLSEDISKDITARYQAEINKGSLSLDEATKQANAEYASQFESSSQFMLKQAELGQSGIKVVNPAKTAIAIGGTIGLAVLSTPALVGYETAIATQTSLAAYSLGTAPMYAMRAGNPNLSMEEREAAAWQFGINVGVGVLAARSVFAPTTSSLFSQYNVKELTSQLQAQPIKISGKEVFAGEKGSYFTIEGERITTGGSAKQTISYRLASMRNAEEGIYGLTESGNKVLLQPGKESYSLLVKGGTSRLKVYDIFSGETIVKTQAFTGGGQIVSFGQGARIMKGNVGLDLPGYSTGAGSYYLRTPNTPGFKSFKFGGATLEEEGGYKVLGVKPQSMRIYETGEVTLKGKLGSYGTITKAPIIEESYIIKEGGGGTSGLSTELKKAFASPVVSITEEASQLTMPQMTRFASITEEAGTAQRTASSAEQAFQISYQQKSALVSPTAQINLQNQRTVLTGGTSIDFGAGQRPGLTVGLGLQTPQAQTTPSSFGFVPALSGGMAFNLPNIALNPFAIPMPSLDFKERYGRKKQIKRTRYRYQPSFAASTLGLRGKPLKIGKGSGEFYGPFRPIPMGKGSLKMPKRRGKSSLFGMKLSI